MGNIRKQTILSSILVYIGFLIGAVNMFFYVKNGSFTQEQFGLTRIFFDFGQNMYVFASLGVLPVIYKFYPYYKDNLEEKKIDLMTWAMVASFIGFIIATVIALLFKPLLVAQYQVKSPMIITYFYWMIPFALGMLLFAVMEAFCWAIQQTVITNALKETVMRAITTIFILLYYFEVVNFSQFIYLFTFLYFIIFLILLIYLIRTKQLPFALQISRVTKKFHKKMFSMQALLFGGTIITALAQTIDSFIIASFSNLGLAAVGVFGLAQYASNLIQVPMRSMQSITAGALSRAWKDKDFPEIHRIYSRSCINLLLMGIFIYGNVLLNFDASIQVFDIQENYQQAFLIICVLGIARLIDVGTGVNGIIIGTSIHWRFDFLSGVVLLAFRIPLTYFLIKYLGLIGSAIAELTAFGVYNLIRFEFLRRKYGMQPFTQKTIWAVVSGLAAFAICYLLFNDIEGWLGIFLRVGVYSACIVLSVIYGRLTPDAHQLLDKWKNKLLSK